MFPTAQRTQFADALGNQITLLGLAKDRLLKGAGGGYGELKIIEDAGGRIQRQASELQLSLKGARFERFFDRLLAEEGGYCADGNDPGGETKFGISKRQFPNIDISRLTEREAQAIYKREYYDPCKIERIADERIAYALFDASVNLGRGTAVTLLQDALSGLGFKITSDGAMGPQTLEACNKADSDALLASIVSLRLEYYRTLTQLNPTLTRFFKGWAKRCLRCLG